MNPETKGTATMTAARNALKQALLDAMVDDTVWAVQTMAELVDTLGDVVDDNPTDTIEHSQRVVALAREAARRLDRLAAELEGDGPPKAAPAPAPAAPVSVSCCADPMVRGGRCDNCETWINDRS